MIEEKELQLKGENVLDSAKRCEVTSEETMAIAITVVQAVDLLLREIAETFDPIIEKAKEAKRAAEGARKAGEDKKAKFSEIPGKAKNLLLKRIGDFKQAEQKRRDDEARAEQARLRKAEEDRQLREAEKLESEGKVEEAEKVISQPIVTPVVTPEKVETPNIVRREVWKFKVVDFAKIPDEYKMTDDVKIGGIVRATKKEGEIIPGIEAYIEYSDYTK